MEENQQVKEWKKKLFYQPEHGRKAVSEEELAAADRFCEGYKAYLNRAKTEREAVKEAIRLAEAAGFKPFEKNASYQCGDRCYVNNRGKSAAFIVFGKQDASCGMQIGAAHIDSPRLDLKPNPLYEELELALLKTHYYGGIRKYQ